MSLTSGWKTYVAAVGLAGLAAYQFSQGDVAGAIQSLFAAAAAAGLRHAVAQRPST